MNELQEALDRIFNNCEEIDNNNNPIEEQTGYKMFEDIKLLRKGINCLQQRIDKAIDYIEKNKLNGNKISEMLCGSEIVKLLEILKESE